MIKLIKQIPYGIIQIDNKQFNIFMYDNKIKYNLKWEPRPNQINAIEFTKEQIRHGKKYMMINSPTGTGKSFFAVMFINWYLNYINSDAKFDILTNSKILQKQYTEEFPFMKSLKGKSNYHCNTYNSTCLEGKEMNKALKKGCSNCPYDNAYLSWTTDTVALTNFHLFNAFHIFVPEQMTKKGRNVLIIDEADSFQDVFSDFITMKISEKELKSLGFNNLKISKIGERLKKIKTVLRFIDFVNEYFIEELSMSLDNMKSLLSKQQITRPEKLKISRYIINLETALESYTTFSKSMDDGTDDINNWVIDVEEEKFSKEKLTFPTTYTIQPVWSRNYLYEYVWKHYDHVIFMSGTLLDKDMFSYLNGLESSLSSYIDIPSPFPVKNRPIYYPKGIGKMTFDNKKDTWEKQKLFLDKIIKKYSNKKGIIHCVNYEVSNKIKDYYKGNNRFLIHSSENRDDILQEHLTSKDPTILVSPSMMNGIDLKDDLSRFQVIMKVPYGNINSMKVKKRQSDNKEWYKWSTCANLIQMCGRSIRHIDDYCDTFILDDSLSNVMKFDHKYLTNYFTESIKILKF